VDRRCCLIFQDQALIGMSLETSARAGGPPAVGWHGAIASDDAAHEQGENASTSAGDSAQLRGRLKETQGRT
jgi:hypothetical protein